MLSSAMVNYTDARAQKTVAPAKPTIVIVHGAWGGAWAFRRVESLLRERGYSVYRPQLTGLGERVHLATPDVNLSTHNNDLVNMILFANLHDATLVGNSYEGLFIRGVANRIQARFSR